MHSSGEVTAFASVRRSPAQTMGGDMPILHTLVKRQEGALSLTEDRCDQLMAKLEQMGAPELPPPAQSIGGLSAHQGAMLAVECVAERLERVAMRLDMIVARLAATV